MRGNSPVKRSNKMLKKIILIGLIFLSWSGSLAPQALGLDLATALALAKQNDAVFRAEIMEARAKDADGWSSVAVLGPRLTVSDKAMRSRMKYFPDQSAGLEDRHLTFSDNEAAVSLDQPLLDMEKIYTARRGGNEMDIAALERVKAREELIVRVIERYFSLLSARDEVDLANSKLRILTSQLQTARAGHDLGLAEQSDVFDIQARYETTRATLGLLLAKLTDAREALAELLGVPMVGTVEELDVDTVFSAPENEMDYWLGEAERQNIKCRISRLQAEAARLDNRIAASRFLPSVSFFVEYERTSPENDMVGYGWDRERTDYGLKLQMELVNGGRDFADMVARKRRYKAARQRVIATHRSIMRQTKSIWKKLQETLASVQAYAKAVAANKKSLQIREAGYREGLQTMLDVLNVQKDYYITGNKYQNARYDYVITLTRFKQLVGNLSDIEDALQKK